MCLVNSLEVIENDMIARCKGCLKEQQRLSKQRPVSRERELECSLVIAKNNLGCKGNTSEQGSIKLQRRPLWS